MNQREKRWGLKRDEDSKAHSKGGRVRKCTTEKMRDQMHTQKEVGLESTLL